MTDEFWRWSAVDIAGAVRGRQVSSREVTESCLARLNDVNPRLNAVADVLAEDALAAADAADEAVAKGGEPGPLHGVPVTVKINVDYAGRATTNGVVAFRDAIADEDSLPVARFRRAGAVIIGRTNVPAFSTRYFTDNDLHGRTLNPWDAGHTPGGSSGGAASAVAAGIGPIAHGNDRAGSVRYPAYCCGVGGLRPSLGRVPAYNPSSKQERGLFSQITSVQGPLARSAGDLRLALSALSGRDAHDPWSVDAVPEPATAPAGEPVRVAMYAANGGADIDPAIPAAIRQSGAALAAAGYEVEEVELPHVDEAATLFWSLMLTEEGLFGGRSSASSASGIDGLGDDAVRRSRASTVANFTLLDHAGFVEALARRNAILRDWLLLLERYPVILMPSSWQLPFAVDYDQQGDAANGRLIAAQAPLTAVSLLGLPGLSIPTGTSGGLPTGVQLVAGRFGEERLFASAEAIEAHCPMGTPIDPRP